MYDIIVLTHGSLADAYKSTLQMFTNNMEGIYAVGLDAEGTESFKGKLAGVLQQIPATHEILVLCDLFGGSPFNTAVQILAPAPQVAVLAGINLPLLLEASLCRNEELAVVKERLKESARAAITEISDVEISDEDE